MSFSIEMLRTAIEKALSDLYTRDRYLIINRGNDCTQVSNHVSERGIVFRFGIYFESYIKELSEFRDYNIDVEYNRNNYDMKRLPSFPNGTYPDLIMHRRGSNKHNLLIIEFKTWWGTDIISDINKVREFMDPVGEYKYKQGLSVVLDKENPVCHWVEL